MCTPHHHHPHPSQCGPPLPLFSLSSSALPWPCPHGNNNGNSETIVTTWLCTVVTIVVCCMHLTITVLILALALSSPWPHPHDDDDDVTIATMWLLHHCYCCLLNTPHCPHSSPAIVGVIFAGLCQAQHNTRYPQYSLMTPSQPFVLVTLLVSYLLHTWQLLSWQCALGSISYTWGYLKYYLQLLVTQQTA